MASYILTNKAVQDLSSIWKYTEETWSEAQAGKSKAGTVLRVPACGARIDQNKAECKNLAL